MKEKRITDIILKGKAKQYYSRCYSELRKQIKDINFYFSAYDIVFLFNKVAKYLDDNGYEDWTKDYKNEQTDIINNEAMDKIIDNATKRQEKAIKENKGWGKNPNEKINTRSNKDYLPNYNKINSSVIDINAEKIRFGYILTATDAETMDRMTNLIWKFDSKGVMELVDGDKVKQQLFYGGVKLISNIDADMLKVNITYEGIGGELHH